MSNAMDGLSLIRSGVDHHSSNHEDNKGVSSPQEDLGENSNGSSNGTGGGDEVDAEMTRLSNKKRGSPIVPTNTGSHHHRHSSNHNHNSSGVHNNGSRGSYCQFETPADETRGTFPDDFDEELFISSGQLVETSNEAEQFDEEMDSSHSHHPDHNHLSHPLNLDTADHSESSDIEEILYPTTNSTSSTTPTGSSSNSSNSSSTGSSANSSTNPFQPHKDPSLTSSVIQSVTEPLEEPMQEDLSISNNADEPHQKAQAVRLVVGDPYVHEQDDVNDREDQEQNTSSSPMRKRKGSVAIESPDETLPAKKSVKEEMMDDGTFSPPMNSPNMEDDEEEAEVQDESISTRAVIPVTIDPPPQMDDWLNIFVGWSHAERLMVINEMIQVCEPTEVRHMMQVIEPQFQRDFISLLPKELALYVLSFLEPKDLLRAAQTCRYWRILCDDNLLWREKCREAGIGYFSAMSQRVHSKRNRANQPISPTSSSHRSRNYSDGGSESPSNMSRWKAAYLRQHNVEMNWRFRPIRPTKILKGHDDHVITCLQFSTNRIVSGSDDNTLKVWSATTGKCLRTLVGHTGGVWSSQMSGTTIVSGSTDRTLRVWNAESGACLHTLYGHTSTVRCMHLYGRKVVSGSRDATLRVWDVDSGECLHVLVGHMAAVRCVQYNGTIVVSGAYDYMVRVWDVEREECLHQLTGHTNRVYSLQFDGIHVVSGSLDTSIRVWDVKTGACKHTLMGHQSLTSGMELRDNLLVSGNADSTVKIWDITTGQCLLTLSGPNKHLSAVTCLQLINKFVITSSDDGTVKLWDIRTGEFVRNLVTLTSGGSGGVVWRIRASETKLVCAVGSRNGTEETKLLVLDFDAELFK